MTNKNRENHAKEERLHSSANDLAKKLLEEFPEVIHIADKTELGWRIEDSIIYQKKYLQTEDTNQKEIIRYCVEEIIKKREDLYASMGVPGETGAWGYDKERGCSIYKPSVEKSKENLKEFNGWATSSKGWGSE